MTSLVDAINAKYGGIEDDFESEMACKIFVPKSFPGNIGNEGVILPKLISLNRQGIVNCCNDVAMLGKFGESCTELDLAENEICSWTEILKILEYFPNLEHLNLSFNELSGDVDEFSQPNKSIRNIVLNGCQTSWANVFKLLTILPELKELHLSLNNYNAIEIADECVFDNIKTLYINKTNITDGAEFSKLSFLFPQLECLVITENRIKSIFDASCTCDQFLNLKHLNISETLISDWQELDKLRTFPKLVELRLLRIPLLEEHDEKVRRQLMVAYLPNITMLNGSSVQDSEREDAERAFIRYYMEQDKKPERYSELEARHGKIDPLVNVNLDPVVTPTVKFIFEGKIKMMKINVKWTVRQLKKKLQNFVGPDCAKFELYYFNQVMRHAQGPEFLRYLNQSLLIYNITDGDEFEISRRK